MLRVVLKDVVLLPRSALYKHIRNKHKDVKIIKPRGSNRNLPDEVPSTSTAKQEFLGDMTGDDRP